jgi:hypothetical protein
VTSSATALARAAAARLLAAQCRGQGELWTRQEQQHLAASKASAALSAARPLLRFCRACPIVTECRIWAETDDYTGIAAGTYWENGREKPIHTARGLSPDRQKSGDATRGEDELRKTG